jgi:hypothetical protein
MKDFSDYHLPDDRALDHLEQYVRCYTVPNDAKIERRKQTRHPVWAQRRKTPEATPGLNEHERRAVNILQRTETKEARAIREIGAPYEGWCLVFDTETSTDTAQALRFGCYEIHGIDRDERIRLVRQDHLTRDALDTLHAAGVFYDPNALTADEVALMQQYATEHDLTCLTREAFVRDVLYRWMMRYDALVIGHNLPFDLSRLAMGWTDAAGDYRGGFSLKLCCCPYPYCFDHPRIRIKLLGKYKARIALQRVKPLAAQGAGGTNQNRFYAKRHIAGKFLDTATLGRALLGPGDTSLAGLGKRFAAPVRKTSTEEHGGALTVDYLDYARQDVAATWSLYQEERQLYRKHGVSSPMWRIYSEASLGKAYLRELGVPPFLDQHADFPAQVYGYGMVAYYGGRSEVRIRLQPTEVIYCDFKSQYPTVNAVMGLQDLLLAKDVMVRDATADVRMLLATYTLDQVQSPAFWRRLRVLVKVRPQDDLLPVRAEYGQDGRNIGDVYVSGPVIWHTLADVLACHILTGKAPEVLQALELVPSAERIQTKPWRLFGDERYTIDLSTHDFFTQVINLRTEITTRMGRAKIAGRSDEEAYLDGLQLGLKLLASSTSYGVLVEMNTDEPASEPQPITVYDWRTHETSTPVLERHGTYFAGAVGALIPAGGRLLLAIAEKLAADRGIGYAMCDTDSMAFARPNDMTRETFERWVREIRDWFTPFSPYQGQPPIFEDEKVNRWDGQPEPLYFLGISAKRYVLYNRLPDGTHGTHGTYRIRKFSSHGVGTWKSRADYAPPPHIPAPCQDVHELGGERWHYDLWYEAIAAIDSGTLPNGRPMPRDERGVPQYSVPDSDWLNPPAFHQVTLSTATLYHAHEHVEGARPFSFITVLPSLERQQILWRQIHLRQAAANGEIGQEDAETALARYERLAGVTFYAPYARTAVELRDVQRSDTHEAVTGIEHQRLSEALRDYYRHPEWKSGDPRGVGTLPRRHVRVLRHIAIGKESKQVALAAAEDTDGVVDGDEAGMDGAQVFDTGDVSGLREMLRGHRVAELMRVTGLPRQTIYDLRTGKTTMPTAETLAALTRRLAQVDSVRVRAGTI